MRGRQSTGPQLADASGYICIYSCIYILIFVWQWASPAVHRAWAAEKKKLQASLNVSPDTV